MGYQQPKWRWINTVRSVMIAWVVFGMLANHNLPRQLLWSYLAAEALWFLQQRVGPKLGVWRKRRRVIKEIEHDYRLLIQYGPAVFRTGFCSRQKPRQERRVLHCVTSTIGWLVAVALDVVLLVLGGLVFFASKLLLSIYRLLTGQKKQKLRQTRPNFKEGAN